MKTKIHKKSISHKINNQKNTMEKVKIKRVKRKKHSASTKEKILAGLGLGGTLLGGISAVSPKPQATQFVRSQSEDSSDSSNSKIKKTLSNIFGIKQAKAFVDQAEPNASTDSQTEVSIEDSSAVDQNVPDAAPENLPENVSGQVVQENFEPEPVDANVVVEPSPEETFSPSESSPSENIESPISLPQNQNSTSGEGQSEVGQFSVNPLLSNNGDSNFIPKNSSLPDGDLPFSGDILSPNDIQIPKTKNDPSNLGLGSGTQDNQASETSGSGVTYDVYLSDEGRSAYADGFGVITVRPDGSVVDQQGRSVSGVPQSVINGINSSLNTTDHRTTIPRIPTGGISPTLLSNAANKPISELSPEEVVAFQGIFSSGGNISSVPDSFSSDSAFAFALGLGGQPIGNDTWVGGRRFVLQPNGTWVRDISTGNSSNPQPQTPPPPSSGPRIGDIRVITINGQQVGQTWDGASWRNLGWEPSTTQPTTTVSRTPSDLGLKPVQGSTAVVDGVEFEAKREGEAWVWVRTGDIVSTPISQTGAVNLTAPSGTFVGAPWRLVITGTPGQAVFAIGGPGGANNRHQIGVIGPNGQLVLTGTFSEADLGTWQQNYFTVGSNGQQTQVGEATFTVTPIANNPSIGAAGAVPGVFSGESPVDAQGNLRPGWTVSGNRYYNTTTGTYSNRSGTVQAKTSDAWGEGMRRASTTGFNFTFFDTNDVLQQAVPNNNGGFSYTTWNPEWGSQPNSSFITYPGAQEVLRWLQANGITGGQIVVGPAYNRGAPEYQILFPNGTMLNAGQVARMIMFEGTGAVDNINAEAQRADVNRLNVNVKPATGNMQSDTFATMSGISSTAATTNLQGGTTNLPIAQIPIGQNLGSATPGANNQSRPVTVSVINVLNTQNQNAGTTLKSGYKVEIGGTNLDVYHKFELLIGNQVFVITNAVITNNKITLTIPSGIPTSILNNSPARIRLTSRVFGVTDGVLDRVFFYQHSVQTEGSVSSQSGSDNFVNISIGGTTNLNNLGENNSNQQGTAQSQPGSQARNANINTEGGGNASSINAQGGSVVVPGGNSSNQVGLNNSGASSGNNADIGQTNRLIFTGNQSQSTNNSSQSSLSNTGGVKSDGTNKQNQNQVRGFSTVDSMSSGLKYQSPGLQMPPGYPASQNNYFSSTVPSQTNQTSSRTYRVKKGDTLFSIAKKHYGDGKKWRKILAANPKCLSISGNTKTLRVGFELVIPE